MNENKYATEAAELIRALKVLVNDAELLEVFQSYLSRHFGLWIEWIRTPEDLVTDIRSFAELDAEEFTALVNAVELGGNYNA